MTEPEAIDRWRKLQAMAAETSGLDEAPRRAYAAAADRLLAKFPGATAEAWSRGRTVAHLSVEGPIGTGASGWRLVKHDDLIVQTVAPDRSDVLLGWTGMWSDCDCTGCGTRIRQREPAWRPVAYNGVHRGAKFCGGCLRPPSAAIEDPTFGASFLGLVGRSTEGYAAQMRRLHGMAPRRLPTPED